MDLQIEPDSRFHWRPDTSGADDGARFPDLCRAAERACIDSVQVPGDLPEALALAAVAVSQVARLRFRIACNPAASALHYPNWRSMASRCILHLTPHPANMAHAVGFIREYRALAAGQIDIEGNSAEAAFLAIKHGDVLWRRPDNPAQVHADALPVLHFGKAVGLVGTVEELADSVHAFTAAGISHFLFEAGADSRFFDRIASLRQEAVPA